ncbi:MAG: hypothetical protein KDK39_02550 [Leptospiraceae bacterium]|nr:hypothetical protein [Leptospiraceae bacterium]
MNPDNEFAIANLNFSELKTIKEACKLYARQGSQTAAQIADHIERAMENITI